MRILLAALLAVMTALIGAPAKAADLPEYPDIEIPDVDYGVEGSFYLRGSGAVNALWTREHVTIGGGVNAATEAGYGYSLGAGFGYETGTGLRVDGTVDYISNNGLTDGTDHLNFRSTLALANIYYDFPLSGDSMGGGFGAYVGAGLGGGYYTTAVHNNATDLPDPTLPDGSGWTPAVAAMAGVSYDAGNWVADLGYRMIYMPQISNNVVGPDPSFYLNDNTLHEVRGTVRYRFQ